MPLVRCKTKNGADGWKWGEKNTSCFTSKKKALEQGRAIEANKHKRNNTNAELLQSISDQIELSQAEADLLANPEDPSIINSQEN